MHARAPALGLARLSLVYGLVGSQLACQDQSLVADSGFNLEVEIVRRQGFPAPEGTAVTVECNYSQDRHTDCPDLP